MEKRDPETGTLVSRQPHLETKRQQCLLCVSTVCTYSSHIRISLFPAHSGNVGCDKFYDK